MRAFHSAAAARALPALAALLLAAACGAPPAGRTLEVRYEPTPMDVVHEMLRLAEVGAGDVVYDLGCGDGRIVIAAAQRGARGVCVELDPRRLAEGRENARRAGVAGRIEFREEDLLAAELRGATVVTLFLTLEYNLRLRPRLLAELAPGTRVVSHWHRMGDWEPLRASSVRSDFGRDHPVFLWHIPAR